MPEASRDNVDEPAAPADTSRVPTGHPAGVPPVRTAAPGSPTPSSPAVRDRFRRQRARDTAPELALRQLLHARGLRYRVDVAPLPGLRRRADVVFTRARLAVFVDGCFWHRCPQHGTSPRSNADWWRVKLDRNVQRDRDTDRALADAGWRVLRVWEHERPDTAAELVQEAWSRLRLGRDRPAG